MTYIIEIDNVRYRLCHEYPYIQREWKDDDGRPYWKKPVPKDEEDKLWGVILEKLNER